MRVGSTWRGGCEEYESRVHLHYLLS
jgi:hypothetical protein